LIGQIEPTRQERYRVHRRRRGAHTRQEGHYREQPEFERLGDHSIEKQGKNNKKIHEKVPELTQRVSDRNVCAHDLAAVRIVDAAGFGQALGGGGNVRQRGDRKRRGDNNQER
jgi:hypothetical protein